MNRGETPLGKREQERRDCAKIARRLFFIELGGPSTREFHRPKEPDRGSQIGHGGKETRKHFGEGKKKQADEY